jgi:hypothetical protein
VKDTVKQMTIPLETETPNVTPDPKILKTKTAPVFSMSENEEPETRERSWRARKTRRQKISHSS